MAPRSPRPARRGFALLVVIWGVGVVTLLIVSFMTTARSRLQAAFNGAGATQTQLLAEAASNLAIMTLLSEQSSSIANQHPLHDGAPSFCSLAGAAVAVAIEDEEGKVDLNAASEHLLKAMMIGFGVESRDADAIAHAIVEFREQPSNEVEASASSSSYSDRPFGPKRAPFQTALELDQVDRMEPALLRRLLPFVTVHSRSPSVDPKLAPPALFAALAGYRPDIVLDLAARPDPRAVDRRDPRFPAEFAQEGAHAGAYLVHVEVAQPSGHTSVGETLVRIGAAGAEPFTILEMRRGESRERARLRAMAGRGLPPC
ncbi:general secretion pathway protein GspK [Methylosinus sp. Sm6]|uniref:general secretion pathway protein GspK n=1 Tax=Methylosinus sp. Sm6 TaxID=2866948 RepID=UPI001C9969A8|nr:type II secretion system protein GspK [Methylosinus sp. Sm6]MBY6242707.1 general secretion pathway protein GspK [Methylosinus sp. Sm6]